jgi:putative addiction module component (TIGR02574 family)
LAAPDYEFASDNGSGNISFMSAALEEITEKAFRLSRQERLALASRLLSDDGNSDTPEIEAAWEEEILARIQAIDDGTAVGIPFEKVIRAARNRRAK